MGRYDKCQLDSIKVNEVKHCPKHRGKQNNWDKSILISGWLSKKMCWSFMGFLKVWVLQRSNRLQTTMKVEWWKASVSKEQFSGGVGGRGVCIWTKIMLEHNASWCWGWGRSDNGFIFSYLWKLNDPHKYFDIFSRLNSDLVLYLIQFYNQFSFYIQFSPIVVHVSFSLYILICLYFWFWTSKLIHWNIHYINGFLSSTSLGC